MFIEMGTILTREYEDRGVIQLQGFEKLTDIGFRHRHQGMIGGDSLRLLLMRAVCVVLPNLKCRPEDTFVIACWRSGKHNRCRLSAAGKTRRGAPMFDVACESQLQ